MSQPNRDAEAKVMRDAKQFIGWLLWVLLLALVATAWIWALLHAGFNVG